MFFRRHPAREVTFEERLEALRRNGFAVESRGGASYEVRRQNCAAIIDPTAGISRSGVLVGDQIAALVDGGYQKFFETAFGVRRPALASDLVALHAFEKDLREALGLRSLYNQSLGTVFDRHAYDRLQGRT